jgi:hypothetical protein
MRRQKILDQGSAYILNQSLPALDTSPAPLTPRPRSGNPFPIVPGTGEGKRVEELAEGGSSGLGDDAKIQKGPRVLHHLTTMAVHP